MYEPSSESEKPAKKETTIDYNPDHTPSYSKVIVDEDEEGTVVYMMQVHGLGVIIMKSTINDQGYRVDKGMAIVTKDELGYSPNI